MLGLPEKAFADPKTGRTLDEFQLADWLEGSITFADGVISLYDVVDVLQENYLTNMTDTQSAKDDATNRVEAAWCEINRRASCLGKSATYRIKGVRLERICEWHQSPVFAFCLLVGLRPVYRQAFKVYRDYTEQGALFEKVTISALKALGWEVHGVGWSKRKANSITEKVGAAARFIGVEPLDGAIEKWTSPKAKDAGLDVICQYVFRDGWSGKPVILTQCASGENWEHKLHTPDLNTWRKLIDFCTAPLRGLSMPFVLRPERFRRAGVRDSVTLLLDRNRLAVPDQLPVDWIPGDLFKELEVWMSSRVEILIATTK